MRESYGGAWLIGLVALFIVLFSGFLAYSISYTKAFNVKNKIISLIEEDEGYSKSSKSNLNNVSMDILSNEKSTEGKAFYYIKQALYNYSDANEIACASNKNVDSEHTYKSDGGYCIYKVCTDGSSAVYYKVTTYVLISLPVINLSINVPISGETKTMYYDGGNMKKCTN